MRIKRIISIALISALLVTLLPTIAFAYSIGSGDYIQIGTYNGQPILWRTVGDTTDGELRVISDKIISIRAFDGEGSALWSTSDISAWLNSSEESGFLAEFTVGEIAHMTAGDNYSAMNGSNSASSDSGSIELSYDREAATVSTNFDAAYKEATAERVYLPSVEDIEYIRNNIYTFGPDYHKAYPTAGAISESGFSYDNLSTENAWYYWLRDAMYGNDDSLVRCVTPANTVEYASASDANIGVRPMCTLSVAGIESGEGTADSPYVLTDAPWVGVEGNAKNVYAGSTVSFNVYENNLPEGSSIEIYHDGELIDTNPENNQFQTIAKGGINCVEAKAVDSEHNILSSAAYSFNGFEITLPDELCVNDTFDGTIPLTSYNISDSYIANSKEELDDVSVNKYIWLDTAKDMAIVKAQGSTVSLATSNTANFDRLSSYSVVMAELTFKFESFGSRDTTFFNFHYADATTGANNDTWSPINIDTSGNLTLQGAAIGATQLKALTAGTWYTITLIVDTENSAVTILLSDENAPDTKEVLCYNEKANSDHDISCVNYANISIRGDEGKPKTVYLDEFKTGGCSITKSEDILGNIYLSGNNKTASVYITNTTGDILNADLVVAVYTDEYNLKQAKIANTNIKIEEGKTYDVTFDEAIAETDIVRAFLVYDILNVKPVTTPLQLQR